ncbi:hypothetical protein VKT23_014498 [Stygiomarasmius scandens]|uniref:Heterokaryon incompatibility domain-containing protein n=1 Tax=Marasmiellus scandens TaxID=2682957 RepID=A0ABR1J1F8_9AGAR
MEWDSDLNPLNLTWSFLSLGIPIPPVSWPVCEYGEVWPRCFIDTSTIQLIDLNADNNIIQPYAILSHSWINREEACYQEFREAATDPDIKVNLEGKSNYQIIQQACLMARQLGIQYLWIDICCIGKDKFSQDINSMFEYYRNSAVCLVYLNDVQKDHIISSKWFEDGWTLQGLLAPQEEIFFDQNWTFIGTRSQIQHHLVSATSIPPKVVKGTMSVGEVDVKTRLKWIEDRQVAKLQDFVYCFMVILDVRMELYYDEPVERTLARFQDEFVRTHPEVSISVVLEYLTWRFLAAGYPIPPPSEWFSREIKACPPFFIDTSSLKIVHLSDGNAVLPYAVLLYQWTPMEPKYEKKSVDLPPKTGIIRRTFHLFKCALKKSKRQSPALQKATEHSLLSEVSQLTELSRLTKSNSSVFSIARQLGLRYLWIDTSSIRVWQGDIELVPSIDNEELKLIHGYYRNATVCLVHLQNAGKESEIPWSEWFKQDSRSAVEESLFFNADWSFRGSRRQFKNKYLYRTKPVRR